MARSQYQYQPLTGPVWRGSVAETLAWLPEGNWQPVRLIPPRRDWTVLPPFQPSVSFDPRLFPWGVTIGRYVPLERRQLGWSVCAVAEYDPSELGWLSVGSTLPLPRRRGLQTWIVLDPFPRGSVVFDARLFPWTVTAWPRPVERRLLGDSVEPFTQALYRPEGLQWTPSGRQPSYPLTHGAQTWVLIGPFPLPSAFDPRLFPWISRADQRPAERRFLGESVEPFTQALYQPAGLQWLPYVPWPQRKLESSRLGWVVLDSFPRLAAFDANLFPHATLRLVIARALKRSLQGEHVEPFSAALYNPARMEWVPGGRQPWRGLVPNRLGWIVHEPLPHAGVALALFFTDESGPRYSFVDMSGARWDFTETGEDRLIVTDDSAERLEFDDRSAPREGFDDTGGT